MNRGLYRRKKEKPHENIYDMEERYVMGKDGICHKMLMKKDYEDERYEQRIRSERNLSKNTRKIRGKRPPNSGT